MAQNMAVMLKRFEQPDEVRTLEKGKFEIVRIGCMTIGRATYEPSWKWSLHVGPETGASSCSVEHVGIVLSGRATAAMDNGTITEMRPGDVFHIAPGHDSSVVGNEPYVSLHFVGADATLSVRCMRRANSPNCSPRAMSRPPPSRSDRP
jgi:hypothetical protein